MSNLNDDLIDVSALFTKLFYPFKLLINNIKTLLLFVCVFIIASCVAFFITPKKYASSFIIKSNELSDRYFLNMIFDIETLVKDKDIVSITELLKINESVAKELSDFKFDFINKSMGKDSSSAVIISPKMTSTSGFKIFENAVLDYLNNSKHYMSVKALRLKYLDSLIKKNKQEVKELDSVKKIVIDNITPKSEIKGASLVYNVPLDPFKGYDVSLYRYKEQLALIENYQKLQSFEIIKPSVVSNKPVAPKFIYYIATGCLSGIICCILFLFARKKSVH